MFKKILFNQQRKNIRTYYPPTNILTDTYTYKKQLHILQDDIIMEKKLLTHEEKEVLLDFYKAIATEGFPMVANKSETHLFKKLESCSQN